MKAILIMLILLSNGLATSAQTWAEWFNQKNTQKKYLVEQIAALKVYGAYVSKGYSITKSGLNTISDFKKGEVNLHNAYFGSLRTVKPAIAHSVKVKDILKIQSSIAGSSKRTRQFANASDLLTPAERQYIHEVFSRLAKDCSRTLDELEEVTTNGKLEMTDDQRIKRIDSLYLQSLSQSGFANTFQGETYHLVRSRQSEEYEIKKSKSINGEK